MDRASEIGLRRYDGSRDDKWAESILDRDFGGRLQARRGELVDVLAQDGFVAEIEDAPAGLLTYRLDGDECEVTFVFADVRHQGIGTALLEALHMAVPGKRIWLVTTNDNLDALRFYQRRGFVLRAVRAGAVNSSRQELKSSIGVVGAYGIPIRDEIELEMRT